MSRPRKLTTEQCEEIYAIAQQRKAMTNGALAERFGVSRGTIVHITTGKIYTVSHVADVPRETDRIDQLLDELSK